jgi:putative PIN family toxin of toxin-antitoxin system
MRLIVLDTNVIVSAGINPGGAPAKIVAGQVLRGMIHLVTCPGVAAEYREVVRRSKFHRYRFPPLWLEYLIEASMQLPNPAPGSFVCPDPKDTHFIALARAAGAWLVTGNLKHFPEAVRNGVSVVSPASYLAHLAGN